MCKQFEYSEVVEIIVKLVMKRIEFYGELRENCRHCVQSRDKRRGDRDESRDLILMTRSHSDLFDCLYSDREGL